MRRAPGARRCVVERVRAGAPGERVGTAPLHTAVLTTLTVKTLVLGIYWGPLRELVKASLASWARP